MAAAGNHTGMAQEKAVAELAASPWHAAQSLQEPAFLEGSHPLPKGAATAGNQSQGLITAM